MSDVAPSVAAETALARAVVARIAPEELPYFEETAEVLVGRGGRRARRGPQDDPLAFGGAAELVVTSIACGVAFEVVKMMGESVGSGLTGRFRQLVARRRARRAAPPDGTAADGTAPDGTLDPASDPAAGTAVVGGAPGPAGGPAGPAGGPVLLGEAPLSEERIAELGEAARRTAIILGLPPDRSDLLAAAVRDHLRTGGRGA
ncbi:MULTISPECIES: hypothetical protein [Streptomyces]|uniref:Uncharacterized protein n=2 Tax=Streptomyces TaxID=1883 RepID=A0A117IVL1_9ACTN|nr:MULTISPECIES: hypothetical protein [Streptomyces]KUH37520.1 hypothetical protein ATE80_17610 [Streptomyces kanasensis]UUS30456.1 hypothetical protein NRO40_06185 [Streptomyces changanensis]